MKRLILKLALLLLIMGVTFIACKKSGVKPDHVNQGTITASFGYYTCADCGGYYIKFTNDTSVVYRTFQDLSSFGVNSSSKFPLTATIYWKPDTSSQLPNFITVDNLKIDK